MTLPLFFKKIKYSHIFFIIFIILIVIGIFLYFFVFNKYSSEKNISDNLLPAGLFPQIEDFMNFGNNNFPRNLIVNGNFDNGKNIESNINQSGPNKIIRMKNPGKSQFVLEQKQSGGELTFYEMIIPNVHNSRYIMQLWMAISNDKKIEEIDLLNVIKVRLLNSNNSNTFPTLKYEIAQKTVINNITWYQKQNEYLYKLYQQIASRINVFYRNFIT